MLSAALLSGYVLSVSIYLGDGKWHKEILKDGLTKEQCIKEQHIQKVIYNKFYDKVNLRCKKATSEELTWT